MEEIRVEEAPKSAQDAFNKISRRRKIIMFIGWAATVLWLVIMLVESIASGKDLIGNIVVGFMLGGFASGFDHVGYLFGKTAKNGIVLVILLGIWYIILFTLIILLALAAGWVFLIIDTVRFFKKKCPVYNSEVKRIFNSESVQTEMAAQAVNASSAAEKLRELKEMLDSGLITESEFNAKREELLKQI